MTSSNDTSKADTPARTANLIDHMAKMTQTDGAPPKNPMRTLWFVALIIFIDMMGIGLIIPVMPSLITALGQVSLARAAEIGGWLLMIYATMQFIFAPIVGGLSDRFGRRPVLLLTIFALGLDYALMAAAPSLIWLFAGRAISGVMGASWAAANSCIADISSRETRGRNFGIMGAAGGAGFVIGPAIGGMLGEFGDRLPFMVACGACILTAIFGFWMLRETLPLNRRRAFSLGRANPVGSLIQMAKMPAVLGFIVAIFFMQLALQSEMTIWAFYGELKFGWGPREVGYSLALFGILFGLVQGVLTGPAIARFGERRMAMASLLFGIPAYALFAYAPSGIYMVAGIVAGAATGFAFPALQSLMSARVEDDAQGELQGAIASAVSMTSIIGPPVMAGTFSAFADREGLYFPGAPFVLSILLISISVIIFAWTARRYLNQP